MNFGELKRRGFLWLILLAYVLSLFFQSQMVPQRRADVVFGVPKYVFGDSMYYLLSAETMLSKHRLYIYESMDEVAKILKSSSFSLGSEGRVYLTFSPLFPIVLLPAYLAGGVFGAYLFNALLGVLTCYAIYRTCKLFVSEDAAVDTTLLFAFGTIIFTYSQVVYSEVLTALLTLTAFYYILLYDKETKSRHLAYSGLASGLLVLAKPTLALVPLSLVVYHLARNRLRGIIYLTAPMAVCALLLFTYDITAFGSPLKTGYSSEIVFYGSQKTTINHSEARFWQNNPLKTVPLILLLMLATQPILAVSFAGILQNRNSIEVKYVALTAAALLLAYSMRYNPLGFWCWSTRLLSPVIPLLAVPFAMAYEKKQVGQGVVLVLALISIALTFFSLAPASWHLFTQFPVSEWIYYEPY